MGKYFRRKKGMIYIWRWQLAGGTSASGQRLGGLAALDKLYERCRLEQFYDLCPRDLKMCLGIRSLEDVHQLLVALSPFSLMLCFVPAAKIKPYKG